MDVVFAEIVNYPYARNKSGIQMHCPELCLTFKFEINQNPLKFTNFSKRVVLLFCSCDSKLILNAGGGRHSNSRIENSHSLLFPRWKLVNSRGQFYITSIPIPLGIFLIRDNLIVHCLVTRTRIKVFLLFTRLKMDNKKPVFVF